MRPTLAAASALTALALLAACGGGDDGEADTAGIAVDTGVIELPETGTSPPAETAQAEEPFQIRVPAGAPIGPTSPPRAIRQLQRALTMLGFDVGTPDGIWGPRTRRAVRTFQRQHDLEPDGLVGAQTARAINRELRQL